MLFLTLCYFNLNLDILGEGDSDDSSDGDDDDDDDDEDDGEGEGQGIVQLHFVTFEERSYSLSLEHYGIYTEMASFDSSSDNRFVFSSL